MRVQFPDDVAPLDPEWFRPLFDLVEKIPADQHPEYFDPSDFMAMGRVLRGWEPDITLFKHRYTSRYLNLDASSLTYRYAGSPREAFRSGAYRRQPLTDALRALGLHRLPSLKSGLPPSSGRGRLHLVRPPSS